MARSKDDEAREARAALQRAEERKRLERDAHERGLGGMVPGSGLSWAGLARMAHARRAAGVELDTNDRLAIEKFPECPSGFAV